MSDMDPTEFEAAKQASTFQLLFRCARLVNELSLARVRERYGVPGLRAAHTALFPHLDMEGVRLTELARRVGVSKQAVGQLVDDLERMGALHRVPDPSDGRAKLIQFKGRWLLDGIGVLMEVERELVEEAGAAEIAGLRAGLIAVLAAVEGETG